MTWINKYSEIMPGNIYMVVSKVNGIFTWFQAFIVYYDLVPFQADNCIQADLLIGDKLS